MVETYAYAFEPPGALAAKYALRELTEPSLAKEFGSLHEAYCDECLRLGYRQPTRRPGSPIGISALGEFPPTLRNGDDTLRALSNSSFRSLRRERNRAGNKLVRDLHDRLSDGRVLAFGRPNGSTGRQREEITDTAWAGAAVRDYPFHGRSWAVDVRDESYCDLTFHPREGPAAWRDGLRLDRALEVASPTQMAAYRRSRKGDDPDIVDLEQSYLHWDLMAMIKTGAFELQVLYPPGPNAEFVRVSDVQSTMPELNDVDLAKSKVKLHGTGWLPARLRHVGIRESAASIKANQTIAADTKAFKLLLHEAKSGRKTKTRDQYLHWLVDEIPGLSQRGAKRAWTAVTGIERFSHWSHSGRMKGD